MAESYDMGGIVPYEPLSESEIINLFRMRPDKDAESRLMLAYTNLVKYLIHKNFKNPPEGFMVEDLFQIGLIGLSKGIKSFDLTKGIKPVTYLARCIHNEILMSFRRHKKNPQNTISLDASFSEQFNASENNEMSLLDVLANSTINRGEHNVLQDDVVACAKRFFTTLSKKDQIIFSRRLNGVSQSEIAKEVSIAQSYVSRRYPKLLARFKSYYESDHWGEDMRGEALSKRIPIEQYSQLVAQGLNSKQIAKELGVHLSTLGRLVRYWRTAGYPHIQLPGGSRPARSVAKKPAKSAAAAHKSVVVREADKVVPITQVAAARVESPSVDPAVALVHVVATHGNAVILDAEFRLQDAVVMFMDMRTRGCFVKLEG